MYYIGIDIGGMSIKGGIVDERGTILFKETIITDAKKTDKLIVKDIETLIRKMVKEFGISLQELEGIGIGCPGSIYDAKGIVRYCCNINFKNTPMVDWLKEGLGFDNIRLSNDANCAALGETIFGAGKGAQNSVMITLGTGVGTGIVVDGKLLTGNQSAGSEGGHITIQMGNGAICGCGKKGHYEAYASATALLKQVSVAIKKYPDSLLARLAKEEGINGVIAFNAAKAGDKVGLAVVKKYIKYVGVGLVNYANIFYPEVIIIGGGISNQGDYIIKPLQKYVSKNAYGSEYNPPIKVVAATLKNDAGIIGAASLVL